MGGKKWAKDFGGCNKYCTFAPELCINHTADRPWEGAKGASFRDFYKENKNKKIKIQQTTISISMKKFTLLLCLFVVSVMMPQVVMADGEPYTISDGKLIITTTSAGQLNTFMAAATDAQKSEMKACTSIVLQGTFNESDLSSIQYSNGFSSVDSVDMSNAIFIEGYSYNQRPEGAVTRYEWYSTLPSGTPTSARTFVGGSLYKYIVPNHKEWIWRDNTEGQTPTLYHNSEAMRNAKESTSENSYAKIPKTYKYRQLRAVADHWSERKYGDGTEGATTNDSENDYLYNHSLHLDFSSDIVKFYHYYQLAGDNNYKHWQVSNEATYNGTLPEGATKIDAATSFGQGITLDNLEQHKNYTIGSVLLIVTYYEKVYVNSWSDAYDRGDNAMSSVNDEDIVDGNFDYESHESYKDDFTVGQWVKMYYEYDYYKLVLVDDPGSWVEQSTKTYEKNISYVYQYYNEENVSPRLIDNTTANNGQYAVVGGEEYVNTGDAWALASDASTIVDYDLPKFDYWKETLTKATLPNGIDASKCPNDIFSNCSNLTKVYSGDIYTNIDRSNGTHAIIYTFDDDEYERVKDILKLYVDQNNISQALPPTTDHIDFDAENKIATVYAETAGHFKAIYKVNSSATPNPYVDGTIFKFTSGCVIDADDLLKLAEGNAKYYIDLYDIHGGNGAPIESAITQAINAMRENDLKYKGLLLPKNPYSIGTTLIKDRDEDENKPVPGQAKGWVPTCTEFVAYNNQSVTSIYVYSETKENRGVFVTNLTKLKSMMDQHSEIANTTIYSVSSNHINRIGEENGANIIHTVSEFFGSDKTIIETIKNDMVSGGMIPNIYVNSAAVGDFASAVHNTSIKNTPNIDLIRLEGVVNSVDVDSLDRFSSGMRVLDLKGAPRSSVVSNNTNHLSGFSENLRMEYVILPEGLDTTVVRNYTIFPNMKAIISIGDTLMAHLNKAGQLVEARKVASESTSIASAGLKKVTIRGELNLSDISTSGNNNGLSGDANNIVTMDLEKAVFVDENGNVDCSQMNFADAGFHGATLSLKNVKLPTDVRMNTIPEDCFYETKSLDSLCIPYNYQVILDGALNETNINHITTTDDQDGAFIDNGPNTYTFSRNLTQLGTTPYVVNGGIREESLMIDANTPRPVARSVFPKETGVKDIYNMATLVPKCYKNVFEYSLTFGYGGQDQTKVYCRDRYYNNGDTRKSFTVLRYPSREVYDRRKTKPGRTWEDTYELMEQKYTDITKVYTKKDQTGAVDANGNPLLWPSRTEGNRTYNQACVGALWNDWKISYAGENNSEINDGADGNVSADTTQNNQQNQNNPSRRLVQRRSEPHSDLIDYLGWHQIVLTQATYFEPVEEDKDEVIQREYVDAGWFTFCIPFDMTYSQVVKMMGVPASTDKVESYYGGKKVENIDSMPDIRQLKSVIRTPNKNNTNTNEILFRLTSNLADKENKTAKYYDFKQDGNYWVPEVQSAEKVGETDKRCLVGGRPYIIKAYKRKGETIADANLGKFILTRYVDEFSSAASCVNTEGTYEQLCSYTTSNDGNVIVDTKNTNLVTMKFAKPYENHKVQAYLNSETDGGQLMFKDSNGDEHPYYYAMVGQFWQQDLPQYCVYMTRSQAWKLYTDPNKGFVWDPYKCVIMATPEVTTKDRVLETTLTADTAKTVVGAVTESLIPNATAQTVTIDESKKLATPADYATSFNRWGGGFRYVPFCYFPMNYSGTKDWIPAPMTLWFFGRNDNSFAEQDQFTKNSSLTRYVFSLDDDDDIFDFGDEATAVKTIDTLNGEMQLSGSTRVYTLSGQYMGNTTEGLSKGVYIVGGRKIVVE